MESHIKIHGDFGHFSRRPRKAKHAGRVVFPTAHTWISVTYNNRKRSTRAAVCPRARGRTPTAARVKFVFHCRSSTNGAHQCTAATSLCSKPTAAAAPQMSSGETGAIPSTRVLDLQKQHVWSVYFALQNRAGIPNIPPN